MYCNPQAICIGDEVWTVDWHGVVTVRDRDNASKVLGTIPTDRRGLVRQCGVGGRCNNVLWACWHGHRHGILTFDALPLSSVTWSLPLYLPQTNHIIWSLSYGHFTGSRSYWICCFTFVWRACGILHRKGFLKTLTLYRNACVCCNHFSLYRPDSACGCGSLTFGAYRF